jgi:hypothetical protein
LECRASVISYRLYFVKNIFEVKRFLFRKNLVVNKKTVGLPNFYINMFDIIQVSSSYLEHIIKLRVLKNLKDGVIYTPVPRYIYMNYIFMFGFIFRFPKLNDLAFPKNLLDYYKGAAHVICLVWLLIYIEVKIICKKLYVFIKYINYSFKFFDIDNIWGISREIHGKPADYSRIAISTILAFFTFFEVCLSNQVCTIELFD